MLKFLIFISFLLLILKSLPAFASDVKIGLIYSKDEGIKLRKGEDKLKNYREAIHIAGGRVVVISEDYDEEFLKTQLSQIEGLLLPGGVDIDPANYGEEVNGTYDETDIDFDKFEFRIINTVWRKKYQFWPSVVAIN